MIRWVNSEGAIPGGSISQHLRRAGDKLTIQERLRLQADETEALRVAYQAAQDASQATWLEPENPVQPPHKYFKLLITAVYCNKFQARSWPSTAVVYFVEEDRTLAAVFECRPGRGRQEYAVYLAGEIGPRIVLPDALFYITDQPRVRGRHLNEVQSNVSRPQQRS